MITRRSKKQLATMSGIKRLRLCFRMKTVHKSTFRFDWEANIKKLRSIEAREKIMRYRHLLPSELNVLMVLSNCKFVLICLCSIALISSDGD